MTMRRSNPWPALADLFAALLVTTFAGLIVIDVVGQSTSARDEEVSREAVEQLEAELTQAQQEVKEYRAELTRVNQQMAARLAMEDALNRQKEALEEQLEKVRQEGALQQAVLSHYAKEVGKGGIDPPPCMLVNGRPQPLVEITVLPAGRIGVMPLDLGTFSSLAVEIPGYASLQTREPIAREELGSIARPVYDWGRSASGAGRFECVFYARIAIETQSVQEVATTLTYINEFFYTQNHADVRAFYRLGGVKGQRD